MPHSTPARRRSIRRERLLAALGEWHAYRLLRVVAPAGFGKSTLGAQWFQQLADLPPPGRPARAWVALDVTDDAPERFLRRLVDALHTDFPEATEIFARGLTAEYLPARILAELLALLGAHPSRVVLLFDDVHRLRDAAPLALLQAILDDGPPNLHLALFSRTRPPLQISRLSLEQAVLTLSARDLNFDHDEFTALVGDSPLASLDAEKLTHLERRAAGWAAGLQILLQASRHDGLLSLESSNPLIADDFWEYIEHEVLQNLPEREVEFLIDISLLPQLTPGLCAAATDLPPTECTELLRRIAAVNELVTAPVGSDAGRAGRIHAVLREYLLRRLAQHHTLDELHAMRRRAALHLAADEEIDAAIDMLLPAPDPAGEPSLHWLGDDLDAAVDIVERACHAALQHGELVTIRRWMRKLPESALRTRPRLAVVNAWSYIHLLEPGSERHLQNVYDALRVTPEVIDDALRAEIIAMEALRRTIAGRYADAWDALQRARALPIPGNSFAAGYLHLCSGFLMYGSRRTLDERIGELHDAGEIFARIGFLRGKIEAMCLKMSVRRIYADGPGMIGDAQRAQNYMNEIGVDASAFRIVLNRDLGDGLYAMNQIDAARAEFHKLQEAICLNKTAAETPYTAQVRLHLCDLVDAVPLSIDDEADEREWDALRRTGFGLTVLNTAHRRIQRDMLRGRPDMCWRTVASLGVLPPDLTPETPLPQTIIVLAGALFAGRYLDTLGTQLIDFRTRMDAFGHRSFKLHAHALLVQLYVMQRNTKAALVELRSLLADLETGGFIRIVLDLPMIHSLLHEINTPFAARLAALTNAARVAPVTISPAEMRVLEQLSTGGSAPQIAATLHLGTETVRSHIKSIYAKLDVRDRTQVLERAREMGLL